MKQKIEETLNFINSKCNFEPEFGIILGTGLGNLANEIKIICEIEYSEIPHFPVSTVESHHGKLLLGTLEGRNIVAMRGRFHYYEGYSLQQITYPIRVMKTMGIKKLFISNAAGGVNPAQEEGDVMIITDHINLLPQNPLNGKNDDEFGPRFPDMFEAYDKDMINMAIQIAKDLGIKPNTGVYSCVQGPNLETPAEYKYLRIIGSDAVGMSTVPEVIVARHMNLSCFAISAITDLGFEPHLRKVSLKDVLNAAAIAEPKITAIIKGLINRS